MPPWYKKFLENPESANVCISSFLCILRISTYQLVILSLLTPSNLIWHDPRLQWLDFFVILQQLLSTTLARVDSIKWVPCSHSTMLRSKYSRLRNKHRATLINFLIFFPGATSLFKRVIHKKSLKFCYLMKWDMFFQGATFIVFPKCSRGYVYSRF